MNVKNSLQFYVMKSKTVLITIMNKNISYKNISKTGNRIFHKKYVHTNVYGKQNESWEAVKSEERGCGKRRNQ